MSTYILVPVHFLIYLQKDLYYFRLGGGEMSMFKLFSKQIYLFMTFILLLIFLTISFSLSLLTDAQQQVQQDISDFSRSTYDILIRPTDARTNIEEELGLVEENYLGIGNGGITLEQWQEIKAHPDVDIAAPVAAIALFNARERTWAIKKEGVPVYFSFTYQTSDGIHTYTNQTDQYLYDFGEPTPTQPFWIFPSNHELINDYFSFNIATFLFPKSYHQVVAIDPVEEEKLVGVDFSSLNETSYDYQTYRDGELSVPVLSLKDVSIPISFDLTIDQLTPLTQSEIEILSEEFIDGNPSLTLYEEPDKYFSIVQEHIETKRQFNQKELFITPDDGHSPFTQTLLFIDEDFNLSSQAGDGITSGAPGGTYNLHSQRIGYRLAPITYEVGTDQSLVVRQIGEDPIYGAPIYRDIEEIEFYQLDGANQAQVDEDFIGFVENGTFSIEEDMSTLASAPLGIYGRQLPYLKSNPDVKLQPSAVPGSFITTPAHGLVSLDIVEKAKGEAPIDAIRVRVAGITGYDTDAAEKLRQLASEWEEQGFTVDIVAGASLQEIVVDVEGIGEVVQSFTTLGAADTVIASWNMLQIVLIGLYTLVAFTFLGFTFSNLVTDRQIDEKRLVILGWEDKRIKQLRYREWGVMLVVPFLIVAMVLFYYRYETDNSLPLLFLFGLGVIVLGLYGFVQRFVFRSPFRKDSATHERSLTLANVRFYCGYIMSAVVQIFSMTLLTSFLPVFLWGTVKNVTETRLGTYIHGEIEGAMVIILFILYGLSFMTIYQAFTRMLKKRQPELQLFMTLGWSNRKIYSYFLKEVVIWTGATILIGLLVNLGLIVWLSQTFSVFYLSIFSNLVIFLIILLLTYSSIYRIINGRGPYHEHSIK